MAKIYLYKILFLTAFWVFADIFIVTYEGAVLEFRSHVDGVIYDYSQTLITTVLITFLAGTCLAMFEGLYFNNLLRRKSLGAILSIKTGFYITNMFVFISVAVIIIHSYEINKPLLDPEVIENYISYISGPRFILTISYWGLATLFALFILHISDKFGQGILFNFLLGKYHQPKQEVRIFMFLDLKSSTSHAEKLGHIKYSRLIQDCFFDLTDIVIKCNAKIYQYVGDEVVLSWKVAEGVRDNNCIKMFYEYHNLLIARQKYYMDTYQLVPEFKAGLNSGDITVAEVGQLKKELAYHGDVLNTAARIQARCNEYQKKLLLSQDLKDQLDQNPAYHFEYMESIILRGKEKKVGIYAAEPAA